MATVKAARPEIQGEQSSWRDGRYRLYTVEHVDFDALPAYGDGGPARVVIDGWSTSTSSVCGFMSSPSVVAADDRMHTLSASRGGHYEGVGTPDVRYVTERHPLDGTKYPTQRDADRAAYQAGLTAFMVYERDAAAWGL